MSKLITRQLKLYQYLLANVNAYLTQVTICIDVYGYVPFTKDLELKVFHDSAERMMLTKDIQVLNKSDEVDKIIMSTPQGIKIASQLEIRGYLSKEYASIFRKLNRARIKSRKVGLDKQKRFILEAEYTPEEFINAFLEEVHNE